MTKQNFPHGEQYPYNPQTHLTLNKKPILIIPQLRPPLIYKNRRNIIQPNRLTRGNIKITDFIHNYAEIGKKTSANKNGLYILTLRLEEFSASENISLYTDNIDYDFFEQFAIYLRNQKYDYCHNTVVRICQTLKSLITKVNIAGYPVNISYLDFLIKRESSKAIFLTEKELLQLYYAKLKSAEAIAVRDRFIIGCYTGMRYADYARLTSENITEYKVITSMTKKTRTEVSIPIHWMIKEIFAKYDYQLPPAPTNSAFNRTVKSVCKKAGLTQPVLLEYDRGNTFVRESVPKYKLVSSHTARRSLATNLFIAKVPLYQIMYLTGHKSEASLLKYIRISNLQKIENLINSPFFVKPGTLIEQPRKLEFRKVNNILFITAPDGKVYRIKNNISTNDLQVFDGAEKMKFDE